MAILTSVLQQQHHIAAQTLESILQKRSAFKNNPQIELSFGTKLSDIAINQVTNKVYVTDMANNVVSVIDSDSGNTTKKIRVGEAPTAIAVDRNSNTVYVANSGDSTVSVIDGFNDCCW
jgi:YVTN family beta-propeller protein